MEEDKEEYNEGIDEDDIDEYRPTEEDYLIEETPETEFQMGKLVLNTREEFLNAEEVFTIPAIDKDGNPILDETGKRVVKTIKNRKQLPYLKLATIDLTTSNLYEYEIRDLRYFSFICNQYLHYGLNHNKDMSRPYNILARLHNYIVASAKGRGFKGAMLAKTQIKELKQAPNWERPTGEKEKTFLEKLFGESGGGI